MSEDVAWLAGWLEGEGAFFLSKRPQAFITVSIHQKDADVLYKAQLIGGGGHIDFYQTKTTPVIRWRVTKKSEVEDLCVKLLPYMGQRRTEQINKILLVARDYKKLGRTKKGKIN